MAVTRSAKRHRQRTPPTDTANGHRQPEPPADTASPNLGGGPNWGGPPTDTANGDRQQTPPTDTASRHRQPQFGGWPQLGRSAKRLRQATPPSDSAKRLRQATPPAETANPHRQPTPPTHTANWEGRVGHDRFSVTPDQPVSGSPQVGGWPQLVTRRPHFWGWPQLVTSWGRIGIRRWVPARPARTGYLRLHSWCRCTRTGSDRKPHPTGADKSSGNRSVHVWQRFPWLNGGQLKKRRNVDRGWAVCGPFYADVSGPEAQS